MTTHAMHDDTEIVSGRDLLGLLTLIELTLVEVESPLLDKSAIDFLNAMKWQCLDHADVVVRPPEQDALGRLLREAARKNPRRSRVRSPAKMALH